MKRATAPPPAIAAASYADGNMYRHSGLSIDAGRISAAAAAELNQGGPQGS